MPTALLMVISSSLLRRRRARSSSSSSGWYLLRTGDGIAFKPGRKPLSLSLVRFFLPEDLLAAAEVQPRWPDRLQPGLRASILPPIRTWRDYSPFPATHPTPPSRSRTVHTTYVWEAVSGLYSELIASCKGSETIAGARGQKKLRAAAGGLRQSLCRFSRNTVQYCAVQYRMVACAAGLRGVWVLRYFLWVIGRRAPPPPSPQSGSEF